MLFTLGLAFGSDTFAKLMHLTYAVLMVLSTLALGERCLGPARGWIAAAILLAPAGALVGPTDLFGMTKSLEPVMATKVRLVDAKLHEDNIHRGPAQVIPAARALDEFGRGVAFAFAHGTAWTFFLSIGTTTRTEGNTEATIEAPR